MQSKALSKLTWTSLAGLLIALIMSACGTNAKQFMVRPPDPNRNLKIHLTGGDDPSNLIGRFIPEDITENELNASIAMQTRCSQFVKTRVSNSNVQRDELFEEDASIGVSVSDPTGGGSVGVKGGSSEVVRVNYTIEKIMEAEVMQPEFDQCCQSAPDQCTSRYIGRFVYGTGQIFESVGNVMDLEGGAAQAVNIGLDVKWGQAWERGTKFQDIYFGFELTQRTGRSMEEVCSTDWAKIVPTSLDGQYFVAVSSNSVEEGAAQQSARQQANIQVVKYLLGEYLKESTQTTTSLVEGVQKDARTLEAITEGLAKNVATRCYGEFETHNTPDGTQGKVRVLAYMPNSSRKQAVENFADAAAQALPADDPRRKQLAEIKKKAGEAQ